MRKSSMRRRKMKRMRTPMSRWKLSQTDVSFDVPDIGPSEYLAWWEAIPWRWSQLSVNIHRLLRNKMNPTNTLPTHINFWRLTNEESLIKVLEPNSSLLRRFFHVAVCFFAISVSGCLIYRKWGIERNWICKTHKKRIWTRKLMTSEGWQTGNKNTGRRVRITWHRLCTSASNRGFCMTVHLCWLRNIYISKKLKTWGQFQMVVRNPDGPDMGGRGSKVQKVQMTEEYLLKKQF